MWRSKVFLLVLLPRSNYSHAFRSTLMLHVCICMCMSCLSVFWKEQLSDRWREWPVFWQIEREMLLKPRFSLIGRICAVCACRGVILPCLHSPQLVHQNRQAILNQFAATAPVGMNMRSGMQQQITPQVNFSSSDSAAWRRLQCCCGLGAQLDVMLVLWTAAAGIVACLSCSFWYLF